MVSQFASEGTTSSRFTPIDEPARQEIRLQLDETLFVEASAGTGKTASLVDRIVNLVAKNHATLDRIAAITFTEAAAAELRDRVRQRLEEAAADESRESLERGRCRQGVSDLDQATISTLHSFAAQLLHEKPLEAGLPPGFDTSDEMVAGIKFDEAWNGWLDSVLEEDAPVSEHLSLALTQNVTLDQLKALARLFHQNYADLEEASFAATRSEPGSALVALQARWPEAMRLCQLSRNGEGDPLFDHVQRKGAWITGLQDSGLGTFSYYRLLNRIMPLSTNRGSQRNWDTDPVTGANSCTALKGLLADLNAVVGEELGLAKDFALANILEELRGFVLEYAKRRKNEGRAEFHDLLVWARDMLRDRLPVRDYFRQRFSHLLIDEAQDTDPIQAEIAMFLAEASPEGTSAGQRPRTWDQILPEKGKLFVVGDPKQSIYRFRRADVEQMRRLQGRMEQAGGRTVSLVQNFRSQEPIISWVNHLFQRWMVNDSDDDSDNESRNAHESSEAEQAAVQAEYEEMSPRWSGITAGTFGSRVWALADEETEGNVGSIRRQEAQDIASLLRQAVDQGWEKLDREATDSSGNEACKPVGYSDICILIRSRTSLPELERSLEANDIPYRLESASLIFETQEVRDLLNCLRAIDNPADRVATVAALRSPAFGCSDVDLVQHYEQGGQFDYLAGPSKEPGSVVQEGLAVLKQFHDQRLWQSPAVLIERFVRDRLLLEAATSHRRMREQWRRYRFMVESAWQFASAGGNSLRAFIGWIDDQINERVRVTETPVPESDEEAVRVMTIHAAKGLEFPVVILTGINSTNRNTVPGALFDRRGGTVEVSLGPAGGRITTPGYPELEDREKKMFQAETVRLMYVATTRARDHLVLSLRRTANSYGVNSSAAAMSRYLAERPELWQPVVLQNPITADDSGADGDQEILDPGEHSVEARDQWVLERQRLINDLGKPSFTSATSLGKPEEEEEDKPEQEAHQAIEPWRRGRGGAPLGRAVHAVLQSIDLATGDGIDDRARAQATAEGIPDREEEIADLARVAVNSDVVRRAVSARRLWREVPVAAPVGAEGFLHGFIDLLFEEDDGLVIVDYKTDSLDREETQEAVARYRLQGGAYAYAMNKATGKPVKEVLFLYLRPRKEEPLPDLAEAVVQAEERAKQKLAPSSAP